MSAAQDIAIERFWKRVDKDGPVSEFRPDLGRCWIWTGSVTGGGYGISHLRIISEKAAHRVSYSLLVRRIPDGFQLDHLCRVTTCVNPDHLEMVTPSENGIRGLKCDLKGRTDVPRREVYRPVASSAKGMRRQDAIVAFIALFSTVNGYPPSVQEITDATGLKSKSAAHYHMLSLRERGLITWHPNTPRSARIVSPVAETEAAA